MWQGDSNRGCVGAGRWIVFWGVGFVVGWFWWGIVNWWGVAGLGWPISFVL